MQKNGLKQVKWRDGKPGFELVYENEKHNRIVRGITSVIPPVFGNDDMNAIITASQNKRNESNLSSRKMGSLVHNHVFHMVECAHGTCKCGRSRSIQLKDMNIFSKLILRVVKEKGWAPLRSELGIYSPEMNLATQIDLLCMNEELQFILVSIKTGYAQYAKENKTFTFKSPLEDIWDTRKNRHQLQLLIEKLILERNYKITISHAEVIYVNSDPKNPERVIFQNPGTNHFPPDTEKRIWSALCNYDFTEIPAFIVPDLTQFIHTSKSEFLQSIVKSPSNAHQTSKKRKRNLPDSLVSTKSPKKYKPVLEKWKTRIRQTIKIEADELEEPMRPNSSPEQEKTKNVADTDRDPEDSDFDGGGDSKNIGGTGGNDTVSRRVGDGSRGGGGSCGGGGRVMVKSRYFRGVEEKRGEGGGGGAEAEAEAEMKMEVGEEEDEEEDVKARRGLVESREVISEHSLDMLLTSGK